MKLSQLLIVVLDIQSLMYRLCGRESTLCASKTYRMSAESVHNGE